MKLTTCVLNKSSKSSRKVFEYNREDLFNCS